MKHGWNNFVVAFTFFIINKIINFITSSTVNPTINTYINILLNKDKKIL